MESENSDNWKCCVLELETLAERLGASSFFGYNDVHN